MAATFKDFRDLLLPTHPEQLHKFMQYMKDNWIDGKRHKPQDWSIFGHAIRTNNHTKGWQHHLNELCKNIGHNNVNIYELIEALHKEAELVNTQCQLVCEEELQRYQRQKFRKYQEIIFNICDDFHQKKIGPNQLLQQIANQQK